jgi:hypothetical protein
MMKQSVDESEVLKKGSNETSGFVFDLYVTTQFVTEDHIHDQCVRYKGAT